MKRHTVIVAIHAKYSDLEMSPYRLFTKFVERQKQLMTMGKALSSNINLVQAKLKHYSFCSKFRTLLLKTLQSP